MRNGDEERERQHIKLCNSLFRVLYNVGKVILLVRLVFMLQSTQDSDRFASREFRRICPIHKHYRFSSTIFWI